MRRFLPVALALAVAGAVALAGGRWLHNHRQRQEALRLAGAGRFADAEPLLERALTRDPADVEVVAALARAKLGDADEAEALLARWCELAPREPEPYRLRMDLRRRAARGERVGAQRLRLLGLALADGQRVLELEPGEDAVRRDVAWLALQVGRFADAERACRACLARAPADPSLLYLLSRACHGQGRRAEAEGLLDQVVAALPGFAEALVLRAVLHREADRPDRAVPLLRRALALERCPRRECLYQLGLALAAAGRSDEARRAMGEAQLVGLKDAVAQDQFPDNAAMRVQVAEAMLDAGRHDEALAVLRQVLAAEPDFAPARRALALYHSRKRPDGQRRAGP